MEVTHTTISRSLIRGILFAAVLCLLFSGSAGATPCFCSDVVISPSSSLESGQSVTGSLKLNIPGGLMGVNDKVTITSPLESLKLSTDILRGGVVIVNDYEGSTISGFLLESSSDLIVEITFSGIVPEASEGLEISVIKIVTTVSSIGTYVSPKQPVVSPLDGPDVSRPNPESTNIYSDIVITPSSSLKAGQSVTGSLTMHIPKGLMDDNDKVTITSPLANLKLSTDILRGGVVIVNDYTSSTLSGFMLGSSSDLIVEITFSGVVSEASEGLEISVIKIVTTVPSIGVYTSPKQPVTPFSSDSEVIHPEQPVTPSPVGSEEINVNTGWNFISVPKFLDSSCDTAGELLGSLDTGGLSPLGYDAKTGWYVLKADTAVKPLDGYWVYSKGADELTLKYSTAVNTPPAKTVYKGWNAVGLSAEKPLTAKSAFSNLDWVRCMPWDTEQSKWGTVIVNGGSSENSAELKLGLGNGHWLYVEADGTYLGNTA